MRPGPSDAYRVQQAQSHLSLRRLGTLLSTLLSIDSFLHVSSRQYPMNMLQPSLHRKLSKMISGACREQEGYLQEGRYLIRPSQPTEV